MLVFAAVMQVLVGLAFVSIPVVRARYGRDAAAKAEAELVRQGVPASVLKENGLSFDASGHETAAPVAVALVMAVLAALNLLAHPWGQTLTWGFQTLVLIGNALILWSQVTAERSVRAAFRRKGGPMLERVDVVALLKAAESGFPAWVKVQQYVRHTVVFAGSVLALVAVA
ncbi:hypothetical protein GCM10009678_70640 [Actinomadura kijaniata]|uniref:Uncharacterized protein n=1 Tax=Actinomadura namibiensis TaxID=182080 RepID=A0A7W3LM36_ACTNM|nr:hypothetical protein [Actinomadura namibiensis]MBA8950535.1 hypothetical protein [Actinomadura namibiensis]